MSNVIILGCGPAGLLAAHAAKMSGFEPIIYSEKVRSRMAGAQFVHQAIPLLGMTSDGDGDVLFSREGRKEGYAQKVYGSPTAPCSWDEFPEGKRPIWSMREMYYRLWDLYSPYIYNLRIGSSELMKMEGEPGPIISTIPATSLCCDEEHTFYSASVWIRQRTVFMGGPNVVTYSGRPTTPWYRFSRLFGHESSEFGHSVPGAIPGRKPLKTDCDCRPNIIRLGRFGKWQKGVLVHHVYWEALRALQSL